MNKRSAVKDSHDKYNNFEITYLSDPDPFPIAGGVQSFMRVSRYRGEKNLTELVNGR